MSRPAARDRAKLRPLTRNSIALRDCASPRAGRCRGVSTPRLLQGNSAGPRRLPAGVAPGFPSESRAHFRPPAANLSPPTDSPRHAAGRAAALGPPPRRGSQARPTRHSAAIERPAPLRRGPRPAGPPWCRMHRVRPVLAGPQIHDARTICRKSVPRHPLSVPGPIAPAVRIATSESVPLGSQAVSHTSVPRRALSVPRRRRWLVTRHPSQFPLAHRPSAARQYPDARCQYPNRAGG